MKTLSFKRVISFILSLILILSTLPAMSAAQELAEEQIEQEFEEQTDEQEEQQTPEDSDEPEEQIVIELPELEELPEDELLENKLPEIIISPMMFQTTAITMPEGLGYGSNKKFIAPIGEPEAGSTPISSRAELEAMTLTGKYHLTQDIDLSGTEWTPIGTSRTDAFTGTFDGQGFVIKGLKITVGSKHTEEYTEGGYTNTYTYEYAGLFGCANGATIKNIGMEGTDIRIEPTEGSAFAGGVCGRSEYNLPPDTDGSFINCYNEGTVSATGGSNAVAGGICGYAGSASFESCFNTGSVTSQSSAGSEAGGICGTSTGDSIKNCYNTGSVSAFTYAGGICGNADVKTVSGCYNTGAVSAVFSAGGICGGFDGKISDCFNAASVSANALYSAQAGGIFGSPGSSYVTADRCYNTGDMFATSSTNTAYAGGICGNVPDLITITTTDCYWNIGSGQTINGAVRVPDDRKGIDSAYAIDTTTALLPAEMKDKASFTGFDFDTVWGFNEDANNDNPILQVFGISVDKVELDKTMTTLSIGATETLTATITPTYATNKTVTWSSNRTSVATVDDAGIVTAVSAGSATITATTANGGKTAVCQVNVAATPATSVTLDKTSVEIAKGDTEQLSATVEPASASQAVLWSSSNQGVATVNDSGVVTAINTGTATITATSDVTPSITADCTVTVVIPATGVTVSPKPLTLSEGDEQQLSASINPSDTTDAITSTVWSSGDTDIATVDGDGLVTAIEAGGTTITVTVTTARGSFSDSCALTVSSIAVTGVSLNKSSTSILTGGEETLTATVSPSNASNKAVTWSSSDETVATVDNGGKVTAVSAGSTTITVTTADGSKTAACVVTVSDVVINPTGVTVKPATAIVKGQTELLIATVEPPDATNQNVTWSSSNEAVATVTSGGVVTAVDTGTAVITVTTVAGGHTAACNVTVGAVPPNSVSLNKTSVTIMEGTTDNLRATVLPTTAADKSVTWSSNDETVAAVDEYGIVTAKSTGTATITATTTVGGKTADCAVTVMPQPPRVKFDAKSSYIYTSAQTSIPFTWTISGAGATSVSVSKNNQPFSGYSRNGNTVTFAPGVLTALRDVYTITVTVTNTYGYSGSDTVTFEVYNQNALSYEIDSTANIDNTSKVAGQPSGSVLAARSDLMLTHEFALDTSKYQWTGADELIWSSTDEAVADVYLLLSSGWTKATPELAVHPLTPVRIVGYKDGNASAVAKHKKTGMAGSISIVVNTLQDKLYLLNVSPAIQTDITYTNGSGSLKTVPTNAKGELAIYEPTGIIGDVALKGTSGTDLYLGGVNSGSLDSGERNANDFLLYPINKIRVKPVTEQKFYTYLPDGQPYTGNVTIDGGLYKNGVFVASSKISTQQPAGNGGSFTISMDSSKFGGITGADSLRFGYEVYFNNTYAPQIIWVDGYTSNDENIKLGNAILRLKEWNGSCAPQEFLFENGMTFDVTNNDTYICFDDENPNGTLTSRVVLSNSLLAPKLKYLDKEGKLPSNQSSKALSYGFASGNFNYYEMDLTINEALIPKEETSYFLVNVTDSSGTSYGMDVPFGIANLMGVSIPEEMLDFNFSLEKAPSGTSQMVSALGAFGDVLGVVNRIIPQTIPIPDKFGFDFTVIRDPEEPLLYKIRGAYPARETFKGQYHWALNGEGKGTFKLHKDSTCSLLHAGGVQEWGTGTVKDAVKEGITGGFCEACAKEDAEKTKKDFEDTKKKYKDLKQRGGSGMSGNDARITAYFEAELGYNLKTKKHSLAFTELGIAFTWFLDYQYAYVIPVPASPIPGTCVTIDFATGVGVEIEAKILPNKMVSPDIGELDWIVLEASAKGYLRLRGAIGLDIWIAAANVGVFGEVELTTEFICQVMKLQTAARYNIYATCGIDLYWRIGPPIRLLFTKLYISGRTILWNIASYRSGWSGIFGDQDLFAPSANSNSVRMFAAQYSLFNALVSQQLYNIPAAQFPMDSPVMDGDENFAVSAWVNVDITEEELERFSEYDENLKWEELTEAEQSEMLQQSIEIANYSDITVSVYENGAWSAPLTITTNHLANLTPIVSVYNGKAVVVWQQMAFSEENAAIDAQTELFYSIYDGTSWSQAERINADFELISDYDVAMNSTGFAVILSANTVEEADGSANSAEAVAVNTDIYTLFIDNAGLLTQNKITRDKSLYIRPRIASKDFIFSYYSDDQTGNSDILLGKLKTDGTVDHDFTEGIKAGTKLYGIFPSSNYALVEGNGEVAVAWEGYSNEEEGYIIYAAKLVENGGVFSFTAPIALTMPAVDTDTMTTVLDGILAADGSIDVLYNKVGYQQFLEGEAGIDLIASGKFENGFIAGVYADSDDVAPVTTLPVNISITNTGVEPINKVTITWSNGETQTWNGLNIMPCEVFTDVTNVSIGQTVTSFTYSIDAMFGTSTETKTGTLFLAKPDVSIGKISVTKSMQGTREFAVNLYNVSDVKLKDSGYSVKLSFFKDVTLSEPVAVTGAAIISDNDMLALIDEGGMSATYKYVIDPADLDADNEVPEGGIRIFVKAEVLSGANIIEESDYSANQGSVTFTSLLRYGEGPITVSVDEFDSSDNADLSLFNRSMNQAFTGSGKIFVSLLNANAEVIETKTVDLAANLSAEDISSQSVQFGQSGAAVVALFVPNDEIYTITFDANGGSVAPASMQTGVGRKLSSLPTPTRSGGYIFSGWFSALTGGTQITTGTAFTQDTTVYARWTYTGGGSSGGGSSGSGSQTPPPVLPKSLIIVDGKEAGIGEVNIDSDITTVSINQDAFEKLLDEAANNITIIIPDGTAMGVLELVLKNVEDMAAKNITLTVQFGNIQYMIPAAAIDTASILAALGAQNAADVAIGIAITADMSAAAQAAVEAAVQASGAELVFPPMEFKIMATYNGQTVETGLFGMYVSRIVEITAEQAARITTAVVIDPDGTVRHVPTRIYQQDGKWYAEVNSLTNSVYAFIRSEKTFKDAKGKWYENTVNEMASRMVISGVGNNNNLFAGEREITRAEFAAIIVRALGLPSDGNGEAFRDVSRSAWYCGAVGKAYEYGLVSGVGNNQFAPDRKITRQEAMLMIQRAAKIAGFKGGAGNIDTFTDAKGVSDWALDAARWNVGSGLIIGSNGQLRPTDNITRAETAALVLTLLQKAGLVEPRKPPAPQTAKTIALPALEPRKEPELFCKPDDSDPADPVDM